MIRSWFSEYSAFALGEEGIDSGNSEFPIQFFELFSLYLSCCDSETCRN